MVRALGYSQTTFDPADAGRLCRGRERWIEPWTIESPPEPLHRLVVTGATFSDDSARDALRGLPHSGIELAQVIAAVFPRRPLLAFMEDGHPADIPDDAEGVEAYNGYRAGGRSREVLVRWHKRVGNLSEIREVLGPDPFADRVRGFVPLAGEEDQEELMRRIFLFIGMSNLDSPPARYQPSALPELLELVRGAIVLHRDKHGPALGVYSIDPVRIEPRLEGLCEKAEALLVRFAIPPMLARWDRALAELRDEWMAAREDEFPVPPAPEPSTWAPRRRRRRGGREAAGEE